jgi:ribonucleoside-diphosphate reductase alpha chain
LKTTYYLRTIGATHTEKSTSKTGSLNAVSADGVTSGVALSAYTTAGSAVGEVDGPACVLRPGDDGFEECEACQ